MYILLFERTTMLNDNDIMILILDSSKCLNKHWRKTTQYDYFEIQYNIPEVIILSHVFKRNSIMFFFIPSQTEYVNRICIEYRTLNSFCLKLSTRKM